MNVLYLINYAGKSGIEKYVENLVRLLPPTGIRCFFAYNLTGPLAEKMAAAGVESLQLPLEWKSVNEDMVKCVIPNGVSRAKLVADQYFDVLYELGRN